MLTSRFQDQACTCDVWRSSQDCSPYMATTASCLTFQIWTCDPVHVGWRTEKFWVKRASFTWVCKIERKSIITYCIDIMMFNARNFIAIHRRFSRVRDVFGWTDEPHARRVPHHQRREPRRCRRVLARGRPRVRNSDDGNPHADKFVRTAKLNSVACSDQTNLKHITHWICRLVTLTGSE